MKRIFATLAALLSCSSPTSHPHVLPNPEICFVVWGGQDPTPFEADWTALFAAGVLDRLAEYGVQGGHLGPTTNALPDLAPAVFDDAWIVETLLAEVTPAPGVIWVVVLPPGSSTLFLQINQASGYHLWGLVPYAVVTANEVLISHEVYEAATDPDGLGFHWHGQEVGDLCEGQTEVVGGVRVQKVWSEKGKVCL